MGIFLTEYLYISYKLCAEMILKYRIELESVSVTSEYLQDGEGDCMGALLLRYSHLHTWLKKCVV